jgi:hypothetical protein
MGHADDPTAPPTREAAYRAVDEELEATGEKIFSSPPACPENKIDNATTGLLGWIGIRPSGNRPDRLGAMVASVETDGFSSRRPVAPRQAVQAERVGFVAVDTARPYVLVVDRGPALDHVEERHRMATAQTVFLA